MVPFTFEKITGAARKPDKVPAVTSTLRFVVLKGVQGFGDRLQCLLQAIRYARATDRYLVVDWRDPDWTHDPTVPLTHFFSLKGVNTFSLEDFLTLQAHGGAGAEVYPPAWTHKLAAPNYRDWIYKPLFAAEGGNETFDAIATYQRPDFDAPVVVYGGVGKRAFAYSDGRCLLPSRWVQEEIRAAFFNENLVPGHYDVVHLRGGSKGWHGGTVPLESLRTKIDAAFPSQAAYFDALTQRYNADEGPAADTVVLTDSRALGQAWIDHVGGGRLLLDTANSAFAESGTHKMSAEALTALDPQLSKERLTVEVLRDFTIMLHARRIVADGVSLFSKMAERSARAGVRFVPADLLPTP